MKKIICILLTVAFISLVPASAAAAKEVYSIKTPSGFISADCNGDKSKLAERLKMSEKQLQSYFDENGILYLAVGTADDEQICLTETETEFSKRAVTLSRMTAAELLDIEKQLAGNSFSADGTAETKNGIALMRLTLLDTTESATQDYLTVCSGKLYSLRITTAGDIDALSDIVISSLELRDYANGKKGTALGAYTILAAAGIAFFAAVSVYLGYTVIRDLRSKRSSEPDKQQ